MKLHDRDAELAVVGAVLERPAAIFELPDLRPAHLAEPILRDVFAAMGALAGREFDDVQLRTHLTAAGRWTERTGAALQAARKVAAARPGQLRPSADLVRTLAVRRAAKEASDSVAAAAHDEGLSLDEVRQQVNDAFGRAMDLGAPESRAKEADEAVTAALRLFEEALHGRTNGLMTGLPKLDDLTGGLRPGRLYVIGARPGDGKTSLAMNWAVREATREGGGRVLVFSLEMPADELMQREITAAAGYTERDVLRYARQRGEIPATAQDAITQAAVSLFHARLTIDDQAGLPAVTICQRSHRAKAQRPDLGLVIVDNLQIIGLPPRVESKRVAFEEATKAFKKLAKDLHLPVLLLAQVNRHLDRENRRPVLADLRDTGAVEQDADGVFLLETFGDPADDPFRESWPVLLHIAKGRGTGRGRVPMYFFPKRTRFEEAADPDDWKAEVEKLKPSQEGRGGGDGQRKSGGRPYRGRGGGYTRSPGEAA